MDVKELKALDSLHISHVDVGVLSPLSPIVHDQLLSLTDGEGEVVCSLMLVSLVHLMPAFSTNVSK